MTMVMDASRPADHTRTRRFLERGLARSRSGWPPWRWPSCWGAGLIDYRVTETLRNQAIGLDAVSLFVVAPLGLFAAALVRRGHVAGALLGLGIGGYTTYMFVQYILGRTT